MNKVYRSVWNASLGTWVAAPENAQGKRKGSQRLACAVLIGSALLTGNQAFAACANSPVCDGAGESTQFGSFNNLSSATASAVDWTFKNGAEMQFSASDANIDGGTHTFENGILSLDKAGAITNGTFNFTQSVAGVDNIKLGTANFNGLGGAIQGGIFNLRDFAHANLEASNGSVAVDGGTFNLYDDASVFVGDVRGGTFNFYDNSSITSSMGGVEDATLNFHNDSTLNLKTNSFYDTVITMYDDTKVRLSDNSIFTKASIDLASSDVDFDLEGKRADFTLLTGSGHIYSSAAVVSGAGSQMPGIYISGNGTDSAQDFSALMDGSNSIEVHFNNDSSQTLFNSWNLVGNTNNTAYIYIENGDMNATGFQHSLTIGNARVTGLGSYNQLSISGTMSPGIGDITTNAMEIFGGTLEVTARDAAGPGNSSRWETDTLTLTSNSRVAVIAESGAWSTQREYEIVRINTNFTAVDPTLGLVNAFDPANVSANFAYLTPTVTTVLDNDQNPLGSASIMLTLGRNAGTFASQANTPNQRSLATAAETLPNTHAVYNYVQTLPVGAPAAAFDSLSGEAHASVLSGLPNLTSNAYRLPLVNLRNSLNAGLNPVAMTAQVGGTLGSSGLPATGDKPAWVELVGNWQNVDGDSNAASLDQNSTGVFAGYDNNIGNGWYLGGALGYTQTDANISKRDSDADINSYSATLYGGKAFALDTQRQLNVLGGISYTYHDIDSDRRVAGMGQKLKSDYDAHTTQVFGEVGYLIGQPDGRFVEPFAGLTVSHLSVDSFTEKGGSAALRGKSENETQAVTSLGLRAQTPYSFGNFGATLRGSLAWQHAFGDEQLERSMAFADGGQAFAVEGVALDRDTAVVGLGTLVNLNANAAVSLDYEGRFASGLRDHGASLKAQWSF